MTDLFVCACKRISWHQQVVCLNEGTGWVLQTDG